MGNTQIISFNVEPEDFNKVLERIDAIAVEQKSSRSAVFRDILYDHFGIVREYPVRRLDFSKQIIDAKNKKC